MSLRVIKAGILDSIQDGGRNGYQHLGINPGGVMDRFSALLANALLGKELTAPVIELHFPAAQILFEKPALICLTGADFTPCLNGVKIRMNGPFAVTKNTVLTFTGKRCGMRCYLSFWGELQLEPWLNSYSTHLKAAAGGYKGRRLIKEDSIKFIEPGFHIKEIHKVLPWQYKEGEKSSNELDCLPGPEWNWLTPESQALFLDKNFTISRVSDRMAYRLQGQALKQNSGDQLVSSAVSFGTIQLLPDGQIILLMSDHQTTGGYPRIASITKSHLSSVAQMSPGEKIMFSLTSLEVAEKKWVAEQNSLRQLQNTCKLKRENWIHAHRH